MTTEVLIALVRFFGGLVIILAGLLIGMFASNMARNILGFVIAFSLFNLVGIDTVTEFLGWGGDRMIAVIVFAFIWPSIFSILDLNGLGKFVFSLGCIIIGVLVMEFMNQDALDTLLWVLMSPMILLFLPVIPLLVGFACISNSLNVD